MRGLPILYYAVMVVPSSISGSSRWVRVVTLGSFADPCIHSLEESLHGAGLLNFDAKSLAEPLELPITKKRGTVESDR